MKATPLYRELKKYDNLLWAVYKVGQVSPNPEQVKQSHEILEIYNKFTGKNLKCEGCMGSYMKEIASYYGREKQKHIDKFKRKV